MANDEVISRDVFMRLAEASGLDVQDTAHMDDLYAYVRSALRTVQPMYELDVSAEEPAMFYYPATEQG